ncbi:MAG: hypothetical protein QOC81_5011 [Thermoanaerobaculia bacterium]|jgi:hypothetical protein|nr:hypothetical protein [Thermoanaerobaculia bacterium]
MTRFTRLVAFLGTSILLGSALMMWSFSGKAQTPPGAAPQTTATPIRPQAVPPPSCGNDGGALNINCPAFPNTTPTKQPQWDYFAWNSFIAANWPAVVPAQNNEQRGFPNVTDPTQSFANAKPNSLLTWETFKEKREVFLYPAAIPPNPPVVPKPWNAAPSYGPLGTPVPMCSDSATPSATAMVATNSAAPRRFFGQAGEIVFDNLDETVEVASEALESQAQLCSGVPNPMCGNPTSQADCCRVPHLPVGPRVWKGSPAKPNPQPVIYEVKVNYDFFNYVMQNKYYLDAVTKGVNGQPGAAANGNIRLPYRTNATAGPGSKNPNRKTGYNAQNVALYDSTITPTSNLLPMPIGAVHLKAAWILLQNEDPSKYHTAEAAYFKTDKNNKRCMAYGTFGLVGLHIIQRVHQGNAATANPPGGTFIFATWEHITNDTAGFTYSDFFSGQPFAGPPKRGFYPTPASALPATRKFPILPGTVAVNNAVHTAIRNANPNSVWLNYQLVGTQFKAITSPPMPQPGNPNDPTGIGQPLFLANLVIETNVGLQNFQGLPPATAAITRFAAPPVGHGQITPNKTLRFNRTTNNMSYNGSGYNMGGCMGCHGVAQSKGFSFSFVLLGGQAGADVDTEKVFTVP